MGREEVVTAEQLERLVDRRIERRLAEMTNEYASGRVPDVIEEGVSRREAMAIAAGGVAGYGVSTLVGGDGSGGGTIVGEGTDDEDGGATAADLQQALEDESLVRISGEIDLSGETPITIPQNTILCGNGVYRQSLDRIGGDGLRADDEGPLVEMSENDIQVLGLAVVNTGEGGDAISMNGFSGRISHTDLFATRYGIDCAPDERTTEPRINFNRVISTTGADGESVGIRVENMNDAKVINNIVAGFDTEIAILLESAIVSLNHTYTFPASGSSVGIRVDAPAVRLVNNRIEGSSERAGIEITASERSIVSQNLVQVPPGADGIALDVGSELIDSFIAYNQIEGYSSDEIASTAISASNVDTFDRCVVSPNTARHFETEGLTGVVEAAGAGGTPSAQRYFSYQAVENIDDNSLWMKASEGMYRIA
ncbi:right-handed parallel beta-helix repeat-containing protein [Halalkalicoccus jeotgali]|uniref:Right handed beta helix domain-containing protein n=1 Tax=Halalkalicoccus jeotgali (strain DSM 18796 / CECT 7217 / JCM 14584 / KCTC 4019 / B3) TaxID=795797 RepID=D8J7I4_HALJB|nr:hypothetical protein [Halalkalicoccus jeotgali]ADJ14079.1 hypothetical protein HacjB3_03440 [Halalkalicoccus jeotgali B3]ELY33877.1 hypothetical protein C497_15867 [Halalkalicoccus jeotgali B3]